MIMININSIICNSSGGHVEVQYSCALLYLFVHILSPMDIPYSRHVSMSQFEPMTGPAALYGTFSYL